MKTKQLANILIKILGLSDIIHSIPSIITPLLSIWRIRGAAPAEYWLYLVSPVFFAVIGIFLVLKSRNVAAFLFKDEDDQTTDA